MSYLQKKVQSALKVNVITYEIERSLVRLVSVYKTKLLQAHRNFSRCVNANKDWFDTYITFAVATHTQKISGSLGGRPNKSFEECTERTKRRKTADVRKQLEPEELAFAAQVEYRARGDIHSSKTIKQVAFAGPSSSVNVPKTHASLPSDKALSLLIEGQLSKFQYNTLRTSAMEMNCNLYPNYETVTEAKKRCYPEGIIYTETSAEVPLQNLMDHTVQRLFLSLTDVLQLLTTNQLQNLRLISKWGCDGSGCHSEYKQRFENIGQSDANMLITSIVPIQLVCDLNQTVLIWQNPRPSSPRYCRPLKLEMAHETAELSRSVAQNVQAEIDILLPTKVVMEKDCVVKHKLVMTMVDGKMINALTDTKSAMRCYICNATSKDFNRIKFCMSKPITEDNLNYGVSSLHAWIRFAEFILHLGYKLKVAKWQARDAHSQALIATEKRRIQAEFWQKLGLHVDKPRQGGGTSTDGNTARVLFQHAEEVAEITGVNYQLISRLHTILKVMSSGHKINATKFQTFCSKTAAVFVMNYPWYYMPTTLHKILIHGSSIIENSEIAIGLMSEDAQESRNKDVRKYRERLSRKFSRQLAMEDTFNRLMVSSDPFITGLRKLVHKKSVSMCQDVLNLLDEPNITIDT